MDEKVVIIPESIWRKFSHLQGLIAKARRLPLWEIDRKRELEETLDDLQEKAETIAASSKEVVLSQFHEGEYLKAKAEELASKLEVTQNDLNKAQSAIQYRDKKIKELKNKLDQNPDEKAMTPKQVRRVIQDAENRVRKETIIEMQSKNEEAIEAALERAENGKNNSPKSKDQ